MARPTQRPNPIREPTYDLPSAEAYREIASPIERALTALKVGAILAAVFTIVLIYLGTYGGLQGKRDEVSLVVLVAFVLPSAVAYVRARRAERRRKARPEPSDGPPGRGA